MSDGFEFNAFPSPLAGTRIICLGIYVPAPVAASRLRELGASIIFVEPVAGDPLAAWCPSWYASLRGADRVLRLDLKQPDPRQTFEELLADADLLLTSLRPAALERLGLGWKELHARHPRLMHIAITGYAAPNGNVPGHDLTYVAHAELATPPSLPTTLLADLAGAERAVSAALTLVLARDRGQETRRVDVSLAAVACDFGEPLRHGLTTPGGVLGGGNPGYGFYRARDGWLAVGALEPHLWAALLDALELDDCANRQTLEGAFGRETVAHWERWGRERGVAVVPASRNTAH